MLQNCHSSIFTAKIWYYMMHRRISIQFLDIPVHTIQLTFDRLVATLFSDFLIPFYICKLMVNIYIYISSTSPQGCNKVLLILWRHDGAIVSVTNLLITLNDALQF